MSKFFSLQRVNRERFGGAWRGSLFFRFCFIAAWLVWLMILATLFFRLLPGIEEQRYIPLHYNVFFGVDKFGPRLAVFQLPLLGFSVLLVNNFLAIKFFEKEKIISLFLSAGGLLVQIMLLAATFFIIMLNL